MVYFVTCDCDCLGETEHILIEQLSLFSMPFLPEKIVLLPNCEPFEEGNRLCRPLQKQLIVEEEEKPTACRYALACIEPNCEAFCSSLQACEVHYACSHRYVCFQCKRMLPNQPTLDLHIQDTHGLYGVSRMDCVNDLYNCFISLCMWQFSSLEARDEHLITDHKYPPNFKFGLLCGAKKARLQEMDISSQSDNAFVTTAKYEPRVPHSVCFGRGSSKAFKRKDNAFSHASNRASFSNQKHELETNISVAELHYVVP